MGYGICICGLNGSGKTALAKAVAKELCCKHMDIEQYYFAPADNTYSSPRTREVAEALLFDDIKQHPYFVFSAVNGNITEEISSRYRLVVFLEAPLDVRMKRIRQRSVNMFGSRALPGGDMYESEELFFAQAKRKTPEKIEAWLNTLNCSIIRLDGTKTIKENTDIIKKHLQADNYYK